MKLYHVTHGITAITVTSAEGLKSSIDDKFVFSSFPKAKKQAVELMKARIADTKAQMAALRATKSLD